MRALFPVKHLATQLCVSWVSHAASLTTFDAHYGIAQSSRSVSGERVLTPSALG